MNPATREESSVIGRIGEVLLMAMELSASRWQVAFAVGAGHRPRRVGLAAGELGRLQQEIGRAKQRLGLAARAPVVSCYETGRDGFWLHRYLEANGVSNLVIEAASTQVDRRQRRAKTDRLDVEMLLSHLVRYVSGEKKVWRLVRVPSVDAEDARHLQRELEVLRRDRGRITARIKSLLATQGVRVRVAAGLELSQLRLWDGSPLAPSMLRRLELEQARWWQVCEHIRQLEAQRAELLEQATDTGVEMARRLMRLRSLGPETSWCVAFEAFAFRQFRNRREVGAYVGLTPTPYESGERRREQGISKAGNVRMRWRMIEAAWLWLRWQPQSQLSRWYVERFGNGSGRSRRIGIVALARKLTVALWRYLEFGIVPEGARLKV